jgi:hypothetical protein
MGEKVTGKLPTKLNSTFSLTLLMLLFCCVDSCLSSEKQDSHLSNAFMFLKSFTPQQGGGVRSITSKDSFEFINRHYDKLLWRVGLKRIPQDRPKKCNASVGIGHFLEFCNFLRFLKGNDHDEGTTTVFG